MPCYEPAKASIGLLARQAGLPLTDRCRLQLGLGGTTRISHVTAPNYRSVRRQKKTHDMTCLLWSYVVMDGLSSSYTIRCSSRRGTVVVASTEDGRHGSSSILLLQSALPHVAFVSKAATALSLADSRASPLFLFFVVS
jgi:hypothetical protein